MLLLFVAQQRAKADHEVAANLEGNGFPLDKVLFGLMENGFDIALRHDRIVGKNLFGRGVYGNDHSVEF